MARSSWSGRNQVFRDLGLSNTRCGSDRENRQSTSRVLAESRRRPAPVSSVGLSDTDDSSGPLFHGSLESSRGEVGLSDATWGYPVGRSDDTIS